MAASRITFLDRAIASVAPTWALQRAVARDRLTLFGYDAARPDGARGYSGGISKNGSSETPRMAMDRLAIMWDARDLERNMPIIRCALDRMAQYVCGTVRYQHTSGDPDLDRMFEDYMADWMERLADVTDRRDFRMMMELGFRSSLRDGDFGWQFVRDGRDLRLREVEADRIGDPNKVSAYTSPNQIQGINIDDLGRPISFEIYRRDGASRTNYVPDCTVPAEQFIHLHRPLRTDEYRTVSMLAPVIAQARDLYEMFAFERGAAKWAASIAGVITVNDPHAKGAAGSAGMWDGKTAEGKPIEQVQGNKLLRLNPNESVTPFNTGNRPSGAFTQYIDTAIRDIAMGLNVPYGFFNMASFGGATVRLEAQQLDRTFKRYQEILQSRVLNRIARTVLNNAIALGDLPDTPAWDSFRWQFGPKLTADTGYDTDANLSLLSHGLKTAASIAGDEGFDYEELVAARIKEVVHLRDCAANAGVPMEMVAGQAYPDATAQLAAVVDAVAPPPEAPTLESLGEGGTRNLIGLLESVAGGHIPPEQATALLVQTFGYTPAAAARVIPPARSILPPPEDAPAPEGKSKNDAPGNP